MSLFKRGADILRANLNALLSAAEDPEKMLNQYLLDAQDGLRESRTAVHTAITSERELQKQWDTASGDLQLSKKRAEIAAQAGKEDLVRFAVQERRNAESRLDGLTRPLADAKASTANFKTQVEALEQRIQEVSQHKDALVARANMARARKATADALSHIQDNDPTSGFASMEAKIAHLEAAADASDEMSHSHRDDVERQFRALESEHGGGSVDDEVAAILAKHKTTETPAAAGA